MRTKDLLVDDSRSVALSQRLCHYSRISGIRYGRDTRRIAVLQPRTSRIQIFLAYPGRFQFAEPSDPGSKVSLLYLIVEAREFQMGMRIDQTGEYSCFAKILGDNIRRSWYARVRPKRLHSAIGGDQKGGPFDRGALDRNQPMGGQPARPHVSGACWALAPFPPSPRLCHHRSRSLGGRLVEPESRQQEPESRQREP